MTAPRRSLQEIGRAQRRNNQSTRNLKKYGTLFGGNTAVTFFFIAHGMIA
jgi:hypothetical protein